MESGHHEDVDTAPGLADAVDGGWHLGLEMVYGMEVVARRVQPVRLVAYSGLVEEVGFVVVGSIDGPGGADGEGLGEELVEEGFVDFFGGADTVGYEESDVSGARSGSVLLYGEPELAVLLVSNASRETSDVGGWNYMLGYGPEVCRHSGFLIDKEMNRKSRSREEQLRRCNGYMQTQR